MKRETILKKLEKDLKPKRIIHTLGVETTAVELAKIYGVDTQKASTAALLHDCAKYMPEDEKMAICAKYDIPISEIEKENTELLHAKAGSVYAKEKYKVDEQDILDAIYYHTTGKANMTLLEEIVFVSDYIEPNRTHSDSLPELRELAKTNLHKTTARILEDTLLYLEARKNNKLKAIDPGTRQAYEFYKIYLEH